MYNLKVISSSVRPGRKGPVVAEWIAGLAQESGLFHVEVLDLGKVNLPLMNEANHPVLQQYEHDHTKAWSAKIAEADAFIFVSAEYDYSYPAPLKNALEYLVHEWAYKAAGVVTYSAGAFAGVRALANLKADLLSLRVVSIAESVTIPTLLEQINEKGEINPAEIVEKSAKLMIQELARWTKGMELIRENK